MTDRERRYCAEMTLAYISRVQIPPGDTRAYLSLDANDLAVVDEALRNYLMALKDAQRP